MSLLLVASMLCLCLVVSHGVSINPTGSPGRLTQQGAGVLMNEVVNFLRIVPYRDTYYAGQILVDKIINVEGRSVWVEAWLLNEESCSSDPQWSNLVPWKRLNKYAVELLLHLGEQAIRGGFASIVGTEHILQIRCQETGDTSTGARAAAQPGVLALELARPNVQGDCDPKLNTLFSKVDYTDKYEDGTYIYTNHYLRMIATLSSMMARMWLDGQAILGAKAATVMPSFTRMVS
ncbi:hypothetical protein SELMODRAFT_412709 [Selaginella moellendorffii]|uniref:Uncharacterized protein n=1 Tax=Selaginella moellendorffii TaxID=88036 RepID=D8RL85_SELML|nr:hypothetical protein SELMODRAFT_412709 [Selaginella moellendorffii]